MAEISAGAFGVRGLGLDCAVIGHLTHLFTIIWHHGTATACLPGIFVAYPSRVASK